MSPEVLSSMLDFGPPERVDRSLSDSVRGLVGSEILKIAAEVRRQSVAGRALCNLTVGDFDPRQFPVPAALVGALHRALDAGETNYPPSNGLPVLRQAVAEFTQRVWGPRYPLESVLIASGARPILYAAYRAVVNPGDPVVFPVPSWTNNHYAWVSGARAVAVPTGPETQFMPTVDQIVPHLSTAKMLCLNSPLNPTGTVMAEDDLREITQAVVQENRRRARAGRPFLFLLHDQIYSRLLFGGARHLMPAALVPESAPWVISLDGISKSFAATGLRVGWVVAAPEVVSRMQDLLGHVGAWAPRPEQVAVAEFLGDTHAVDEHQARMNREIQRRLELLHQGLLELRRAGHPVECIEPQGAIYLSARLDLIGRRLGGRRLEHNEGVRQALLEAAGVAVVPFQAFGLPDETGWFRLSVGAVSTQDIEQALPRLRGLLEALE
jgi:aspartate aminotransferase